MKEQAQTITSRRDKMQKVIVSVLGAGAALALTAAPAMAAKSTIVDRVLEASGASGFDEDHGDFDITRDAVVATGLDKALSGNRQLTVFAPTDQAFLNLTGAETEEQAFEAVAALGIPTVKKVLKYHVAPGRRDADQVVGAKRIPTLYKPEDITKEKGSTELEDATGRTVEVVAPNAAKAKNGIVHALDGVLLPFTP
jgi:uncharacterized surface protein with fasciclin (FAS1) repeats